MIKSSKREEWSLILTMCKYVALMVAESFATVVYLAIPNDLIPGPWDDLILLVFMTYVLCAHISRFTDSHAQLVALKAKRRAYEDLERIEHNDNHDSWQDSINDEVRAYEDRITIGEKVPPQYSNNPVEIVEEDNAYYPPKYSNDRRIIIICEKLHEKDYSNLELYDMGFDMPEIKYARYLLRNR